MALKAKYPHIRIDEKIWDDPVMIRLSSSTFKTYIFAIAWSKCQQGRTPDGILTSHGLERIGATEKEVSELVANRLIEACEGGYRILKYEDWQMTSDEEKDEMLRSERQSSYGKAGAAKRWSKAFPPEVEEGFDVDKAFEDAWSAWPDPSEPRYRERREDAYESFRANITNSKDFASFSSALMKRIKDYEHEPKPKAERRMYLGAFKNFCDGRWKDWIPRSEAVKPPAPEKKQPSAPEPEEDVVKFIREKSKKEQKIS